jgi:phosphomannomutase
MKPVRIASVSGLRGVVGNGFDPLVAVEYAAAYASRCGPGPILVGHDGRATADAFVAAVASAIACTGHDARLLGPVATPTIGRLVRTTSAAGGVQISASHNPPEYNGLKCFMPEGMVLSPERGRLVLDDVAARHFAWVAFEKLGKFSEVKQPWAEHLQAVLEVVDAEAIRRRRFRVLLDASHGAGGAMGEALLTALGCQVAVMGGNPDGCYEHPPEPTEENLQWLCTEVHRRSVDIAFAQDPDADRLAIVDDRGRYIGEEFTLALATLQRLSQQTGPIVANLSTSKLVDFLGAPYGVTPVRTPVGEYHVASAMRQHGAVIGGEGNGGVIDPRIGWVRDSFVGMALVLELLAARNEPLSAVVDRLPRLFMIKSKHTLVSPLAGGDYDRLAAEFPDASADRRDGLRLDWPDRWLQVRASNTEPIVRVIAEAASAEATRGLIDQVAAWLGRKSNADC